MAILEDKGDGRRGDERRGGGGPGSFAATAVPLAVAATLAVGLAVYSSEIGWPVILAGFAALAIAILATRLAAPAPAVNAAAAPPAAAPVAETRGPAPPALGDRVRLVVSALPDPCLVVNRRQIVLLFNDAARQVLPQLKVGDPFAFVMRAPEAQALVAEALKTGQPGRVGYRETVPVERSYEISAAPIRLDPLGREGAADHVVLTIRDRTDQQRLERMRVDFIANASHELRTPLASLQGFVETLQGPARNDPAARERFLEIMRQQAVRMARLIDDLLHLSRIELNEHVRPTGRVDLAATAAQTIDALQPMARERGVTLAFDAPQAPYLVRGEADDLYRVAENLIENAIKYGRKDGRVAIGLVRAPAADGLPAGIVFSVADDGPGIAAEHIPRLTERFYRADPDASRDKGGTGLGLAIVKHILTRHGARLGITSELGKGAVFSARFDALDGPPRDPGGKV